MYTKRAKTNLSIFTLPQYTEEKVSPSPRFPYQIPNFFGECEFYEFSTFHKFPLHLEFIEFSSTHNHTPTKSTKYVYETPGKNEKGNNAPLRNHFLLFI